MFGWLGDIVSNIPVVGDIYDYLSGPSSSSSGDSSGSSGEYKKPSKTDDGFSFSRVLESAAPSLITGGAGLLMQGLAEDKEMSLQEKLEQARAFQDLEIEKAKKLKELGLTGGGGGGRRYQEISMAPLAAAQQQAVQAKLAQAQLFGELADKMSGRLSQAMLSRRR